MESVAETTVQSEMIEDAATRGHVMVDLPYTEGEEPKYAPGVFAQCYKCGAHLRWYKDRAGGEASVTWCPVKEL